MVGTIFAEYGIYSFVLWVRPLDNILSIKFEEWGFLFMPCSFKVARSSRDKVNVYKLRHRVFVEEEERFHHREGKIYDEFDALDETCSIIAICDKKPVGTVRATTEDNPLGLPPLEHYDFRPYMSRCKGKFAGVSWLCISKNYRVHRGLLPGLFKTMVRELRKKGARHLIAALHPGVLPLLKHYGAKQVDSVFHSEKLNVPMVPIHVDLEQLPNGIRENSQDPLNLFFDDSNERRIYIKGEKLTQLGDIGNEAFLIMRGSVQVLLQPDGLTKQKKPEMPLLGPGQIFGELALLDGGPRTATVVCHSREVDVMIYSRSEFLKQMKKDQSKALAICRIVGARFRYLSKEKKKRKPQHILIARILSDASRKGQKSVEIKFLANQCGMWIKEIRPLLQDWQHESVIDFDGHEQEIVKIVDYNKINKIIIGA